MICRQCEKEKLKSTVTSLSCDISFEAYEGFYDEDGNYHYHDPNIRTSKYKCSNGHRFEIKSKTPCPNSKCNYGSVKEYNELETEI